MLASSSGGSVRRRSPRATGPPVGPLARAARRARPAGRARPRCAWCRGSTASSSRRATVALARGSHQRAARRPRSPRWAGSPPTSLSDGQPEPAVERGVLDALGHHRAAGLLEPHDELVAVPAACRGRPSASAATRSSGAVPVLGEPLPGRVGSGGRRCVATPAAPARPARRRRGRPGRRRAARPAPRAGRAGCGRAARGAPGRPRRRARRAGATSAPQRRARRRSRLASSTTALEVGRLAGELGVERRSAARRAAGSTNSRRPRQQRVVPGRARARPVAGQLLVALEDLLDDHPRAAGRLAQPPRGSRAGRPARRGGRCAARRRGPRPTSASSTACVAAKTSGSSTRTPTRVSTSKNRR